MPSRLRALRSGPGAVLILMTGAFLVTGVLALQGWRAARAHEAMTRRALDEYAQVALWEFGRVARWDLLVTVSRRSASALFYLGVHTAAGALPAVEELPQVYGRTLPPAIDGPVHTYVRFDAATGAVALQGRHAADSLLNAWLPDQFRTWMREVLPIEPVGGIFILPPGAPEEVVAFGTVTNLQNETTHLLGIVTSAASLRPVFDRIVDSVPILPPAIAGGLTNRELVSLEVRATQQPVVLYRSDSAGPAEPAAREPFAPYLRDAELRVALRPEGRAVLAAGMPSAVRGRTLAMLLVGSAGLLGLTLVVVRRELELARLRADFVAGVSHELRTPVSQIRMFAETLQLGRVRGPEERAAFEAVIVQESQRLSRLVNDVLLFGDAERGGGGPAPRQPVDLRELVAEIVAGFSPLAATRQATVVLAPGPSARALADPDLLRHALLNLLDNALKYGPAGQAVTVTVREHDGRAEILVADQGPGIPADEAGRIWQRFVRLPRDRNGHVAGAGIGLAVVRDVMGRQGGGARLEPAPGGGACFILSLPPAGAAGPATPPGAP